MRSTLVQELVARLEPWLPPHIARVGIAVVTILVGYVLAWLARYGTTRLLARGSRWVSSLGKHKADSAEAAAEAATIRLAGRAVFWLVFVLFLGAGTTVLGFPVLSSWLQALAGYLPHVLASAAIVLLGVLSGLLVKMTVNTAVERSGIAGGRSLGRAAQIAVIALSVAVAIEELGISITILVVVAAIVLGATLGAAGLAFGLGARTSVSNLLAGHYLTKWYRPGQTVRVGEQEGQILEILPSAVILQTRDGKLYIPADRFAHEPSLLIDGEGRE